MSEASDNRPALFRHHGLVRVVLAACGAVQLSNGLWALLAPRSFYTEFRSPEAGSSFSPPTTNT